MFIKIINDYIMSQKTYSYSSKSLVPSPHSISPPKFLPVKKIIKNTKYSFQVQNSGDSYNPKYLIFCLMFRTIFKRAFLRYTKFAFYLMRSLYKEYSYTTRKSNVSEYNKSIKSYEVSTEIIAYPISPTQHRNSTPNAREIDKPGVPKKSLYMDRFRAKKNEKNKVHYRAFNYLTKLNSNYAAVKQIVFIYWNNYTCNQKLFHQKTLGKALSSYLLPVLQNLISKIFSSVSIHRKLSQSVKNLVQILEFVHYKSSTNLKANALLNIRNLKKKHIFDMSTTKFLFNFVRILSTKIFSKYFYAFIAIKEYSDQFQKKSLSDFYRAADFYTKLSRIFNRNHHNHIPGSFNILKVYYYKTLTHDNAKTIIKILRKIFGRLEFCNKFESFDTIKAYSLHRHRLYFSRASKLVYLLKKLYTKFTALGFL